MAKVGDWVVLNLDVLPPWFEQLPEETKEVFRFCAGRAYEVVEIDEYGQLVLDVSSDVDERFGGFMNDIRVEEKYVISSESK